jgi:predicted 3-demethylubiquinone-9 3-methyltransferase (glyoxalase superfamily)
MLTVIPFLWFESQAEDAAKLYTSVFTRSKITAVHGAPGQVMSVEFELEGQKVMALNGNPQHRFNESFSFFVGCDSQAEIDDLWTKLLAGGGQPSQCGWLKDRFGISWQIVPKALGAMLSDPDRARSGRALQAMLQMTKIDLPALQRAYEG